MLTKPFAPFHSRDLRKARYSEPGRQYLLTAVTLHRRPIFTEWSVARLLVAEMRAAETGRRVQSLA